MVDLVVFLIDRKDLDDQTVDEYNSFEKDCVDNTDSTAVLISMLKSSEKKMIVTTIQKMANAVKNPKYAAVMDAYKNKKVVFIIDECHRSQFGKMHGQIEKHLKEQITSDSLEHRFLRKTRVRMVVPQLIFSMQEISWIHACINT